MTTPTRYRPLNKDLTETRARELIAELGFLGIVDLVLLMAAGMDGSMECVGERVIVKIKKRKRPPKTKPTQP